MTTLPLSEFASGTLDGSGAGTLKIGPAAHGVLWKPVTASIKMTGAAPSGLATCTVYVGSSATSNNFVDATYDVNNAATGRVEGSQLRLGNYIWAVWAGGNAGATVTLNVTGTKDI